MKARAQQSTMPVIGFLRGASSLDIVAEELRPFRQGLKDAGYADAESVAIEYRAVNNQLLRSIKHLSRC